MRVVAALLLLLQPHLAVAIDFNIRGQWIASFGYGANGAFEGQYRGHTHTGWGLGQDSLEAKQKITLQLDAMASDSLSSTLSLEMGDIYWGQAASGGAIGADKNNIKATNAFVDVATPDHNIKARMGIYGITTPAMASGNCVFNGTVAGVTLNTALSQSLGVTLFWARLFNDNYPGRKDGDTRNYHQHYMDNIDAFALLIPWACDSFSITPWLLHSASGPNAFRSADTGHGFAFSNISGLSGANIYRSGMFPAGGARHKNFADANGERHISSYNQGWWAGLTGRVYILESLRLSFDSEYGEIKWRNDGRLTRRGWFASLLLEYLFDWGKPGIYAWHSSGDDGNPANGSERMPSLDGDDSIGYSHFAFNGSPYLERNSLIGANLAGTMGVGARVLDAVFINNISHIARVNLFSGTNSPVMAKKMSLGGLWANGKELASGAAGEGASLGMPNLYLTSADKALEVSSSVTFRLKESFLICLQGGYIALWLDTGSKVWGARHKLNEPIPQTRDAWNANISFVYSF